MNTIDQVFAGAPISRQTFVSCGPQKSNCTVAVIGAGPYGLAAAAHLKAAGIHTRVFGDAMVFWRKNMPRKMFLRHATDIADPQMRYSFEVYKHARGATSRKPLPIEDFITYGEWFQREAVADLEMRKVILVSELTNGFQLTLEDGESVHAKRVVVAMGLANQDFRPAEFDGISANFVSHTSEHTDFDRFRGCRVAVIGRGQSACESAVLLREAGAQVEIISRGPIHWIGDESWSGARKASYRQLHSVLTPKSAVGPFPLNWLVDKPGLMHSLPRGLRNKIASRSLRPAATAWLRPRANGIHIDAGPTVRDARTVGGVLKLQFDDSRSGSFDHALLATGYHIDIAKFGVLAPELLAQIECTDGSPILLAGCESSVPGLHFIGASAVRSFGPLMRFVSGSGYAARAVTRAALGHHSKSTFSAAGRLVWP